MILPFLPAGPRRNVIARECCGGQETTGTIPQGIEAKEIATPATTHFCGSGHYRQGRI